MSTTHWPQNNLVEVISFLNRQHPDGIRATYVSERLGVTPQAVSSILKSDDASLAWLERMAKAYGYVLCLRFPTRTYKAAIVSTPVNLSKYPSARNLSGLVEYSRDANLTINALAKKTGLGNRIIKRAFEKGDIKISNLKRITKALGINIDWEWIPVKPICKNN